MRGLCCTGFLSYFFWHEKQEAALKYSPPSPAVLTQALGQRPIPGAVPMAGDGAGAKQVIAGVTAVRNARLEAVAMWPTGQYLPDAVIDMTRLCAVHN